MPWRREGLPTPVFLGFPGGSAGEEPPPVRVQLGLIPGWEDALETWVQSLGEKMPWRREWLPTLAFLPGEFHVLYSPWGHKESNMTFTFTFLLLDMN